MAIKNSSKKGFLIEGNIIEEEVLDWYSLTPAERFLESQRLWEVFILFGGNLDPEPDTQSPFHIFET
jgi:hypothetical protein